MLARTGGPINGLQDNGMAHWLLKSEPETWSWHQQVARGNRGEIWDGVRNHQAAGFLRRMKRGDHAYFYHSGKERRIIGIVEVIESAFPDPTDPSGKFVAVKVRAVSPLPRPVALAEIKAESRLADLLLLRQSRLSVMPLTLAHWKIIQKLASS
jgi:predicted RNA-binding protein with PUA-like domain